MRRLLIKKRSRNQPWIRDLILSARAVVMMTLASINTLNCSFAADLSKLPDPIPKGVIRVWATGGTSGNRAGVNDSIALEMRNLDGWLMDMLDYGRMTEAQIVKEAPPEIKTLIRTHSFRFAVAAAIWMEEYEKLQLETTQSQPDPSAELADLRKFYSENETILNDFQPPPLSENDPKKIRDLLDSFRSAKVLIVALTNSVKKDLVLCINRIALTSIKPENPGDPPIAKSLRAPGDPKLDTYHWLRFTLKRDANNESDWSLLLSHPSFSIPATVTVRVFAGSDTYDLPTAVVPDSDDPRCRFFVAGMQYLPFWGIVAVLVFCIVMFWRNAGTTDLIRDADAPLRPDGRRPFSLARSQMAMWFFLILGSFAFLWVATDSLTTLNDTCLWLIGIGSGTALGAAVISVGTDSRTKERYPSTFDYKLKDAEIKLRLENQIADAETRASDNSAGITDIQREQARELSASLRNQLADFKAMSPRGWRRVMEDWLSENGSNGTWSFHRFQMLGWTLVLGLVFFLKVVRERNIPEFNTQLLALLGISAGTYIGFKLPAQKEIERKNQRNG